MLIGEFESRLTDKNRLAVPKKLRAELSGKLIVSRGYEGCLLLLDEERWQELITQVSQVSILNLSVRDTLRFLLGGAFELEPDAQGRFVLAPSLREYSKIEDEVVFIGLNEWVEIWDKQIWQAKLAELQTHASDIAEQLLKRQNK